MDDNRNGGEKPPNRELQLAVIVWIVVTLAPREMDMPALAAGGVAALLMLSRRASQIAAALERKPPAGDEAPSGRDGDR